MYFFLLCNDLSQQAVVVLGGGHSFCSSSLLYLSQFLQFFLTALAVQASAIQAYGSCSLTHSAPQQRMSVVFIKFYLCGLLY